MTDLEKASRERRATEARQAALESAVSLFLDTVEKIGASKSGSVIVMSLDHPAIRALRMAAAWDGKIPDSNQMRRMSGRP